MSPDAYVPNISIDHASSRPLHAQISEPIAELIQSGELAPGTRIEDEVSMAKRLQVSRPTARRALETLVQLGLVTRRRGVGTQVAPRHVHRSLSLTSLFDDLETSGAKPRTNVLSHSVETAPDVVAKELGLEMGATATRIRRLRFAFDEPIAILTNWLPNDLAPTAQELESNGLYTFLRERGAAPIVGQQRFSARLASSTEAKLLHERPGSALLTVHRTAYDESNRVVEMGDHVYRASIYSYESAIRA